MRIVDIQWHLYRVPFVNSFTTAHGIITAREGAIIEVTTDQGITGVGEIAPLPEFAGSSLAETCKLLPTLSAYLRGKTAQEALDLMYAHSPDHAAGETAYSRGDSGGNTVQTQATLPKAADVGTVFIASAVEVQYRDCFIDQGNGSPPPLHLHGGRDEYGPYEGSPYLNGIDPRGRPILLALTCGLETALLDILGKSKACSIGTLLSSGNTTLRSRVAVNVVIGARATEAAVAAAQEARSNGFGCVKLKVGVKDNVQEETERIAAVREAIGPEIHLRLDANEAWSLEAAMTILLRCVPYNIQYVEQPLKAQNLSAMRILRHTIPIPIAADEAVHDLESARLVMEHEAADILVIKPQLAGGLRMGQQIISQAAEHNIQSVITSTIETGIGLTAALHLAAASPTVTLECGLATLPLLVDDLLVNDLPLQNGFIEVPTGPGLGVELDRKVLERYCI